MNQSSKKIWKCMLNCYNSEVYIQSECNVYCIQEKYKPSDCCQNTVLIHDVFWQNSFNVMYLTSINCRHGVVRTDELFLNDPALSFKDVFRNKRPYVNSPHFMQSPGANQTPVKSKSMFLWKFCYDCVYTCKESWIVWKEYIAWCQDYWNERDTL